MTSDLNPPTLVMPLEDAEQRFLQVLVTRFALRRQGRGVTLELEIPETAPTIWSEAGRRAIRDGIEQFDRRNAAVQTRLDAVLLGNEPEYEHADPTFPFRYVSGGTLPIVRRGGQEYYCLFYREITPIGWNIANGGAESRVELLEPGWAIEREAREELVIVDPKRELRYVFEGNLAKPLDRPEFEAARRFWGEHFPGCDLNRFRVLETPLKWLRGPDSLSVRIGKDGPVRTDGCFVNVNAEDFGIEVDRVAMIHLNEDVILCDGELFANRLVNAPVGLFEVERLNSELRQGGSEFRPDFFFFSGRQHDGELLERVVMDQLIPHVAPALPPSEVRRFYAEPHKFDLCPVTSRIIRRYVDYTSGHPHTGKTGEYDVFLSFGAPDEALARRVCEVLDRAGRSVYFSARCPQAEFSEAIYRALERARCLVAVSTDPAHLQRNWVKFEINSFHALKLSCKPEALLIPFISGFEPHQLPLPLAAYEAVLYDSRAPEHAFERLLSSLPG